MSEIAPTKIYVKSRQPDLYPPNNSRPFLENMAEAELTSRYNKFKSKARATNTKKPSLLDKY